MGCGKSKHDVAAGNTIHHRKKSSTVENNDMEINIHESGKEINNNTNIDNSDSVILKARQEVSENVNKAEVRVVDEDKKVQEALHNGVEKREDKELSKSKEGASDSVEKLQVQDLTTNGSDEVDGLPAEEKWVAEEPKAEKENENAKAKEDLIMEEKTTYETNASTSDIGKKDLSAEEGQSENSTTVKAN